MLIVCCTYDGSDPKATAHSFTRYHKPKNYRHSKAFSQSTYYIQFWLWVGEGQYCLEVYRILRCSSAIHPTIWRKSLLPRTLQLVEGGSPETLIAAASVYSNKTAVCRDHIMGFISAKCFVRVFPLHFYVRTARTSTNHTPHQMPTRAASSRAEPSRAEPNKTPTQNKLRCRTEDPVG